MTHVLLISDTERVQRVFETLEGKGLLQLRTAPSLVQGDEEISAAVPDYLFLQSRISGLSGEIAARHLQKSLPKNSKVVLLAVDEEDAAQARKHGKPFLSLDLEDQELSDAVAAMVQGKRVAKKTPPESKPRPVQGTVVSWLPPSAYREPEPEPAELYPLPSPPVVEVVEFSAPLPERPAAVPEPPPEGALPPAMEPPGAPPAEDEQSFQAARSFAEFIDRASTAPVEQPPEVEDYVNLAAAAAVAEEAEPEPFPEDPARTLAARLRAEEYLSSLQRREKHHKRWVIPLALALVFVPLVYFFTVSDATRKPVAKAPAVARKPTPAAAPAAVAPAAKQAPAAATLPHPAAGASAPAATPQAPAPAAPSRSAALPPAAVAPPAASAPAASAKLPIAPRPATPAPLASQSGLKTLPPFLAGVSADPDYARKHPGWQRFEGARAEYRLFKEGDRYKALQVLAQRRQSIPDELFKRVLLEFGGSDNYLLESREQKGPYLIERGEAKGNLALTVYRNNKDLAVKGLVLYYR